jgi:hypothetical protein
MLNNRLGCINRDKNAVNNMIRIVKCFIKNKDRPIELKRDTIEVIKKTKIVKKKVDNHQSQVSTCHASAK